MTQYLEKNKSSVIKIALFTITIVALYIIIKYLFAYVAPFFVGWLISLCINPIFILLNKKLKITAGISVLVSLIVFLFIIWLVGNSIVVKLITEGKGFIGNVPIFIEQSTNIIERLQTKFLDFCDFIPDEMSITIENTFWNLVDSTTTNFGVFLKNKSLNLMTSLPSILIFLIVTVISAFFFTKDRDKIYKFICNQMPNSLKKIIALVIKGILQALSGYVKAQLILMLITFTTTIVGLFILGYPYAFFLGLIISVIDMLPVFGSGFILWPWAAYNVLIGDYKFAIGLVMIYLIIILSRQTIEPKFIGKQIGIHPLATLMSIFIGLKIFGVLGFIIGPFILVTMKSLQESNILPNWK